MASALEAVPLRLTGGQTVEVQLAARQPATGACEPLAGGERLRIRDGGLTVSVPGGGAAGRPPGSMRIVPHTKASYVRRAPTARPAPGSTAPWPPAPRPTSPASWASTSSRTSPVAAARAVTWLARALDDAGAYAAVVHGPAGPPDEAGRGVDGRRGHAPTASSVTVRATGGGGDRRAASAPSRRSLRLPHGAPTGSLALAGGVC